MREPTYRQALSFAWQLVWHHKSLWALGLLAIFAGHLGVSNFIGYIWAIADKGLQNPGSLSIPRMIITLPEQAWTSVIALLWAAGVLIILAIMVIFLGIAAQGALIAFAADWHKTKKADMYKAWAKGVKHFWRIFSIEIIEKIILCGLLIVFASTLRVFLNGSDAAWSSALLAAALGLIAFVGLIVIAVTIYALGYAVIEEKPLLESLFSGLSLFWRHLLVSFEVSIVLMAVDLIVIPVIGAGVFLAFLPSLAIWVTAGFANNAALMGMGLLVGMILWSIFIVMVGAVFNAFATNAWTYLFMKMHHEGLSSRVIHWAKRALSRV